MNENTAMRYTGRPIDLNLLSVLDITSEGKVVSAANWNTLWETVLNKINTIDEYCVGIDALVLDWKSTTEQLNKTIADFNTKYEGLSNSFVHYGTEAPTNPHQRLWLKECDDVNLEGFVVRREFIQCMDKVMFDKADKQYVDNAVAEAVNDKPTIYSGTAIYVLPSSYRYVTHHSSSPYKVGDMYFNTAYNQLCICEKVEKVADKDAVYWTKAIPKQAGRYDPESSDLQTGRTVAEAINKIIGDIGDEQTVAEMFSNVAEVIENEYVTIEALEEMFSNAAEAIGNEFVTIEGFEEIYFNIIKIFGVLGEANPYFADSILYANSEGNAITADDIKIGDLRNAINDIADFKETAVSKEYIDGLVGDINEALETALNGGM